MLVNYIELSFSFYCSNESSVKLPNYPQSSEILLNEVISCSSADLKLLNHHASFSF